MNAAREIADSLRFLREGLSTVELTYDQTETQLDVRENRINRVDNKIDNLMTKQKEIINFNVGGKLFLCNLQMIKNFPYENILTQICEKLLREDNLQDLPNITIDRNPKHFKTIIEIFRRFDDKRTHVSDYYTHNPADKINLHLKVEYNIEWN